MARSFRKLKLNFSPVVPPGGGLLAQVLLWVKQGQGPSPALPGREDDDPGLQFPRLHQQGRHVLGPRVKLQHLLSLRCEQEC